MVDAEQELAELEFRFMAAVRDRVSSLMTDVWVRRAAQWQLVTRHISPLAL